MNRIRDSTESIETVIREEKGYQYILLQYTDDTMVWRLNGKTHREPDENGCVGPACISEGMRIWSNHGNHHREDGPAVEWSLPDDEPMWYLHGKEYKLI